ncbi:L-galactose dehydrogenase [Holothuria leucospilota]|uniref:L-galactose dehydrogenase n=1 Tax=Holothuria leucospilota TaxID=206669 RepID=A0A9Q0YMP9_HOLLE|nr:L-galactose dehydrogenase [Holothuria leucospilota]
MANPSEDEIIWPKTYVKGFHDDEAVRKMKYSNLGNTGMQVSVLGFGASPFSGGYHPVSEEDAISSVRKALTNGINYIDTAPWYGDGKSEEMLGKALKDIPRESYYMATKVGRYKPEVDKMFDFSAAKVLSGFEESLQKLGLSYVDLIQVHDLEFAPNPEIILNETLPAVQTLVDAGKAKYIGITGYPVDELKNIYERSTVKIDTILSYSRLTLSDSSLLGHVDFMKKNGVGLINASPLSMGLLTHYGPPKWHPASEEVREAAAKASLYCQKEGVDLPKIALNFTLSQKDIPITLMGMSSVSEVDRNLAALEQDLTEKEREVKEFILTNYFDPVKEKSWEGREVAKYWRKLKALQEQQK